MLSEMLEKEVNRAMDEFMVGPEDANQIAKSRLFDKIAKAAEECDELKDLLEEVLFN